MKKIRLSKAKKKVLAALERQRNEMMAEMKGEAISYYAKVVFCTLKWMQELPLLQKFLQ